MNVYIITASGTIEETDYRQLILSRARITTTPRGVGPAVYVEEATWYSVNGELFASETEAANEADAIEENTGARPVVEEVQIYEVRSWGVGGNNPRLLGSYETREAAEALRFESALFDFHADPDAPPIFETREEAEKWLIENT